MTNYVYLLQEREFIKTKENIYKVGMTQKENFERFNQYPKGSVLLFQTICNDCKKIENQVIKQFKEKFIRRDDIGSEYFEGNYKLMIDIIYLTVKNECNEEEDKYILTPINQSKQTSFISKDEEAQSKLTVDKCKERETREDQYYPNQHSNHTNEKTVNIALSNYSQCIPCGFKCNNKKDYKYYSCEKCDYNTSNKKDYKKHLNTIKHIGNKLDPIYSCEQCDKVYQTSSGLWKHNKTCIPLQQIEELLTITTRHSMCNDNYSNTTNN